MKIIHQENMNSFQGFRGAHLKRHLFAFLSKIGHFRKNNDFVDISPN